MAEEFDDDDDAEFGGFEMADAPVAAEAQPLPPALLLGQIVGASSLAASPSVNEPVNVATDGRCDQPTNSEITDSAADVATATVSVASAIDTNGVASSEQLQSSPSHATSFRMEDGAALVPALSQLIESSVISSADGPAILQLEQCRSQLNEYQQKYSELQQQHNAELVEMQRRTREAVEAIVQQYQKLLQETVEECESTCHRQMKDAIDAERALLADAVQNQRDEFSKLMEQSSRQLADSFDEHLTEQRLKQQEVSEELRQEEERRTEERISLLVQEKDAAIKQACEEAVEMERERAKQTLNDEREQLLKLVEDERGRSRTAVEELMAAERIKLQDSIGDRLKDYESRVDQVMSSTLQHGREQIKTYVDEQRREDEATRLRLLSSVDVLLNAARSQLRQLIVSPPSNDAL